MSTSHERERIELRATIERLSDRRLKTHMLIALGTYDGTSDNVAADGTERQTPNDSNDAIAITLRTKDVTTKSPRDALFLAVHAILLELGFTITNSSDKDDSFPLPADWDANSGIGLFTGSYKHPNDSTLTYELQGLFVGNKFEVYISTEKKNTHSIELSIDNFVALSATTSNAGDLLRDLATLRSKLTPFFENIAPTRPIMNSEYTRIESTPPRNGGHDDSGRGTVSPFAIPPVGLGDVLPPGLGGGDPSMHVGPNHAIFGQHYDPSRGPVPGARFDPFGPISTDPQGPPRGFVGGPQYPGPAPNFPFGDPNPDHLRMPRDDEMNDPYHMRGGRPGPSRGFGSDFHQPFGSGGSFF